MKALILGVSLFVLLASCVVVSAQTGNDAPLTNVAVVKLVKANFKEKTIITIIGSRASHFDLSPDRMIELKRSGVSERIILAMLARQQGVNYDEAWDNDAFFLPSLDGSLDNHKDPSKPQPNSGASTDIFGSSGGVRGNTQQRGGNSSNSGDLVTTGSATVRIVRPPSEAGAVSKLEKVSTLTNSSIVEFVEAGFSEGTIIRRIELSPVDFDLSPEKLADLRKRGISEKILSAMKAATGETSDSKAASGSKRSSGR